MADDEEVKKAETPVEEKASQQESPREEIDPLQLASGWLQAGTSWGSSWITSAKQKTMDTLELVKKDLNEFTDVIASEATVITTAAKGGLDVVKQQAAERVQQLERLVSPTEEEDKSLEDAIANAAPLEEGMEKTGDTSEEKGSLGFSWMRQLVSTVQNLAVEETTNGEDDITEAIPPKMRQSNLSSMRLHELQSSEATYTDEPTEPAFESFVSTFRASEHEGEMQMLLANAPAMRKCYAHLVPRHMDSFTFWCRYFFKMELAEAAEEMREKAEQFTLSELTIQTEQPRGDEKAEPNEKTEDTVSAASGDNSKKQKKKKGKKGQQKEEEAVKVKEEVVKGQPTTAANSCDEWSMCSKDSVKSEDSPNSVEMIEGAEATEAAEHGPLTPKADGEGWVDWDE